MEIFCEIVILFGILPLCVTQPTTEMHVQQCSREMPIIELKLVEELKMKISETRDMCDVKVRNVREELMNFQDLITQIAAKDFPLYQGAVRNISLGHDYLPRVTKKSWEDARQDCFTRGFHLAEIESSMENSFVHSLFSEAEFPVWIAGSDSGHEGCWVWTSSTVQPFNSGYTAWYPGEPNNDNGGGLEEHCASLQGAVDWYDFPCSREWHYVCKRPIGQTATSLVSVREIQNTPLC